MKRILAVAASLLMFCGQAFAGDTAFATGDRGSGAYEMYVITGEGVKVGNGTPTTTMNGEDAYVEGTFEVDGAARFDGAITAASTLTVTGDNKIATTDRGQTIYTVVFSTSLADTQEWNISTISAKQCAIDVYAVGHASGGSATMKADGAITLIDHTNMNTADNNDTTLNLFDAGTTMTIENQLGGTYTIILKISYVN
jgi:hypothetical protein